MGLSADFRDELLTLLVRASRVTEGTVRDVGRLLFELRRDLSVAVANVNPTGSRSARRRAQRLAKVMERAQPVILANYRAMRETLSRDATGLARLLVERVPDVADRVGLGELWSPVADWRTIVAAAREDVVGQPLAKWWSQQQASTRDRFRREMNLGIVANEPRSSLVTRARRVVDTSRHHAETLVRTSMQTVQNEALRESYEANDSLVEGVEADVTFDLRTSDLCKSRSGGRWNAKTGEALPSSATSIAFPGYPPWHPRCRTFLVPFFVSEGELNSRQRRLLSEETKASMDGEVAGNQTYEDWLKTRSAADQREALGDGRYRLWKDGKIRSFRELTDQTGRPLKIEEF